MDSKLVNRKNKNRIEKSNSHSSLGSSIQKVPSSNKIQSEGHSTSNKNPKKHISSYKSNPTFLYDNMNEYIQNNSFSIFISMIIPLLLFYMINIFCLYKLFFDVLNSLVPSLILQVFIPENFAIFLCVNLFVFNVLTLSFRSILLRKNKQVQLFIYIFSCCSLLLYCVLLVMAVNKARISVIGFLLVRYDSSFLLHLSQLFVYCLRTSESSL